MYSHFLQSEDWQNFQKSLKKTVFTAENKSAGFSYLAILETTKLGNYLYLPYGPSLSKKTPEDSLKSALAALTTLAKHHHCFFIRLEPSFPFKSSFLEGLKLKKSKDLNPAETWTLDLRQSREDILKHMSQGTRTRHNGFTKKGLSVEVSTNPEDIKSLVSLQKQLAHEKGLQTFSESYLKTELEQPFASLYLVHYRPEPPKKPEPLEEASKNHSAPAETAPTPTEDKIIAASLFFDDKAQKTRFYMQSAADSAYKKLPGTVALLSTAIFDAKEKGLETFDFWGIAPENAPKSHPWAGFTQFKKSFGGSEKHYSGTWDFPLNPSKYRLYTLLRSLNRSLRKLKA